MAGQQRQAWNGIVPIFRLGVGDAALQRQALKRQEHEVRLDALGADFRHRAHQEGGAEEGVQLEVVIGLAEGGGGDQQAAVQHHALDPGFPGVGRLGREGARGVRDAVGLAPVQVEAAVLAAARPAGVEARPLAGLIFDAGQTGPGLVLDRVRLLETVEGRVGPGQAQGAVDHAIGQGGGAGAAAVGVLIGRAHVLGLVRAAQAPGQRQAIGDGVGDLAEQGRALRRLPVAVHLTLALDEALAHRQAGQGRDVVGVAQRIAARARQQAADIGLVVRAVEQAVAAGQLLVRQEQTRRPIEAPALARQADLLRQGAEAVGPAAVVGTIGQVGRGEVPVLADDAAPVAHRRGRVQLRPAQVGAQVQGQAPVADAGVGVAVRPGDAIPGPGRRRHPAVGRERRQQRRRPAGHKLHADAAALVPLGPVGGQAGGQVRRGAPQQLAAQGVVVLVLIVGFGARAVTGLDVIEAVAAARGEVQTSRQNLVHDRAGQGDGAARGPVVAKGRLARHARGEGRRGGDDVDHAGRGVLAEQGGLRALQHLDALDLAEVAQGHAVAGAIDAVDHDADRAFQPRIVAHRADAADAGRGEGLVRGRGHDQARRQDLQVLDVAHADVVQQRLGRHRQRQGRGRQRGLAPLGRHHDLGHLGRPLGCGVLGEAPLSEGRRGENEQGQGGGRETRGAERGLHGGNEPLGGATAQGFVADRSRDLAVRLFG
ncbi:hypothetical protein D3C86_942890 [compost metagenome]